MKKMLVFVVGSASLWDGFTTVYGTTRFLGNDAGSLAAAFVFAALIMSFLLNTRRIIYSFEGFTGFVFRFLWFVSICYDLYTSWIGNNHFLVGTSTGETERVILIAGLTVLVSGSPIVFSLLWSEKETVTN